jgi:hypothetical protein
MKATRQSIPTAAGALVKTTGERLTGIVEDIPRETTIAPVVDFALPIVMRAPMLIECSS